ncbi:MAG TPA: hypothetical protein VMW18_06100 [Candidatus Binatia bacterium]|nr:hypothetical protein [Candidatus Binatia bacterium]
MDSYQENIGRARIAAGLMIAAVLLALVAPVAEKSQAERQIPVLTDGVMAANGE